MDGSLPHSPLPLTSDPPQPRRAVIDIGTNSVKLLVAEVDRRQVKPVHEAARQTRLGKGFYPDRHLRTEAIDQTARAVDEFRSAAKAMEASSVRVIATSVVRDALNVDDLLAAIHQTTKLPVEILSGEQEARWAYLGATTDPTFESGPLLVVDAGGGSTEFVLGQARQILVNLSSNLGTVRLLETVSPADPPSTQDWEQCANAVRGILDRETLPTFRPEIRRLADQEVRLLASSGTATILAMMAKALPRFERNMIDGTRLSHSQVKARREQLWQLSLAQRREIIGLPPDRADVILSGVAIYEQVMDRFRLPELWITTRGLRFAALL